MVPSGSVLWSCPSSFFLSFYKINLWIFWSQGLCSSRFRHPFPLILHLESSYTSCNASIKCCLLCTLTKPHRCILTCAHTHIYTHIHIYKARALPTASAFAPFSTQLRVFQEKPGFGEGLREAMIWDLWALPVLLDALNKRDRHSCDLHLTQGQCQEADSLAMLCSS